MTTKNLARKIAEIDTLAQTGEGRAIAAIESALEGSFEKMLSEFRRKWIQGESKDIGGRDRAILLLSELEGYLSLVRPGDQGPKTAYERLVLSSQALGLDYSAAALKELSGFSGSTVRPNLQAVAAQVEDSAARLYRHSEDFRLAANQVITQGLVMGSGVAKVADGLRRQLGITKSKAQVIARTESMSAIATTTRANYEANGIEHVQRIATQDSRVCRYCAARAGAVYEISKSPGLLHPQDRCYEAPWKPEWVQQGLIDSTWIENHRDEVQAQVEARGEQVDYGPSPFERMAGQLAPKPVWLPRQGFVGKLAPTVVTPPTPTPPVVAPIPEFSVDDRIPEFSQDDLIPEIEEPDLPELSEVVVRDVALDREALKKLNVERDEAIRRQEEAQDALRAMNASPLGGADPKFPEMRDQYFQATRELQAWESKAVAVMADYRDRLLSSGWSAEKAAQAVDKISINSGGTEAEVRTDLIELFQLTGGRLATLVTTIVPEPERASARPWEGKILLDTIGDRAMRKETLWHEVGHFSELDMALRFSNNEWVLKKATGPLTPLTVLDPKLKSKPHEVAFPGEFYAPYVARYYGTPEAVEKRLRGQASEEWGKSYTEVISMGMEKFTTAERMFELYQEDRGHFELMEQWLQVRPEYD